MDLEPRAEIAAFAGKRLADHMIPVTLGANESREVSFSTNYLDLRDGDSATIHVTGLPDGFDPARLGIDRYAGQDRR
jgi:hypothetical protein